jgi:hypothetical protein
MHCRIFVLAAASCGAMLLAACSAELPASPSTLALTAGDPVTSAGTSLTSSNAGAIVNFVEFGPSPIRILPFSSCLGERVLISGTVSGRNQIVTMPDGTTHLTQLIDVSQVSIALGDAVWTPGPSAQEIFIINEGQSEHVGKVVFRSEDGRPELRLVHTIHAARLPSGELQVNRQIFDVLCVGQNR